MAEYRFTQEDIQTAKTQGGQAEVVPAGEYTVKIVGATPNNEKEYITPRYEVVSGPYVGKTVLAGQWSYKPNARGIFLRNCAGAGLDEAWFLANSPTPTQIAEALKGRIVTINLTIDYSYDKDGRNKLVIGGIKLVDMGEASNAVAGVPQIPQVPATAPATAPVAAPAPPAAPAVPQAEAAPAPPVPPVAPPAPPVAAAAGEAQQEAF